MSGRFQLYRGPDALKQARFEAARLAGNVRVPHHTASLIALTGRLSPSRVDANNPLAFTIDVGEVMLANRGTLILDDFPEFKRAALEVVAGIFRLQRVTLHTRHKGETLSVDFPLYFDVLATAELCPCGHPTACHCTDGQKGRFEARIADARRGFLLQEVSP